MMVGGGFPLAEHVNLSPTFICITPSLVRAPVQSDGFGSSSILVEPTG